ncbi:MAG: PfkB family carbohydrate kinase [Kiritimatiellia bacterium]|nr:PfkB family carbohydrate kinase [Kiritimatiellia bacterium]
MQISLQRAKVLIARFRRQKILVAGDLMLDRYIYGTAQRLSPEAPVPIVRVREEKNMPGGAANVARNVKALGGGAAMFGAIGADQAGRELLNVMHKDEIETGHVTRLRQIKTTVKMRIIAERQQVVRVDWDSTLRLDNPLFELLCRKAAAAAARASGIILADYAKGIICQRIVDVILGAAKKHNVPVALDPKENRNLLLDGISVITPNHKEAFALAGMTEAEPAQNPIKDRALLRVSDILLEKWHPNLLIVTLGARGMLVAPKGRAPFHVATAAREVFDVSGAGDTTIATMLLALTADADYCEAAELANCAAGVVVGKIGTAVCSSRELLEFMSDLRRCR